jgi:hypothetical protein
MCFWQAPTIYQRLGFTADIASTDSGVRTGKEIV